jgi:hypothetical protein
MNIKLLSYSQPKNSVKKSYTTWANLTGSMRDTLNVVNPVFLVQATEQYDKANAVYCEELDRYYFITGKEWVRTGLLAISCHVDVLVTYQGDIWNNSGIISRNSNLFNGYLPDNKQKVFQYDKMQIKVFPRENLVDTNILITVG